MVKAVIEKKYYSGESVQSSRVYVLMAKGVDLPPSPFVGMTILSGRSIFELDRVYWDADEGVFSCNASPGFLGPTGVDSPNFDEWIKWQEEDGWKLCRHSDNDDFVSEQEDSPADDDEKIRQEISRISESARFEMRRRMDEATWLGSVIVTEKMALEKSSGRLATQSGIAKQITWGFGIALIFCLIDSIFLSWFASTTHLINLSAWGVLRLAYSEIICPSISLELQQRQRVYEDACYRWHLATGVMWSEKTLAAERASRLYNGEATPEEINQHAARIEQSILRIVKNRNALRQYDLW